MHPTHYSCPSSSTTDYAQPHIATYVRSLLSSAGFSKSSSQAIELLTEVFERYLLLLASKSKHHSNHVGRRISLPCDVEWSLNDLGTSTTDIQRWFDEEGGDIAGRWLEVDQNDQRVSDLPSAKLLGGE
jgi:histone H3/H4